MIKNRIISCKHRNMRVIDTMSKYEKNDHKIYHGDAIWTGIKKGFPANMPLTFASSWCLITTILVKSNSRTELFFGLRVFYSIVSYSKHF